jgi:hypothetical protein
VGRIGARRPAACGSETRVPVAGGGEPEGRESGQPEPASSGVEERAAGGEEPAGEQRLSRGL